MSPKKIKKAKPSVKVPGNIRVLWDERTQPSRGPRPTLSADQIARVAIRVADAEGLDAVSMQRIAREVQVTTMALYRYFSSKAELVTVMVDAAGGPAPHLTSKTRGWRPRLKEWTHRCASIYREHPWFLQAALAQRRMMGPNELGWLDTALTVLNETELPLRQQHQAFLLLMGHVRSNAEFAAAGTEGPSAEQRVEAMTRLLGKKRASYPSLVAAIDAGMFSRSSDDGLSFGLECILDGIESAIAKQKRRS